MPNTKKFLDSNGVAYLASLLDNYPDNEILSTVIGAIQEALDEKANTEIYKFTLYENNNELTIGENNANLSEYCTNGFVIIYYNGTPYFYDIDSDRGRRFLGLNGNWLLWMYSAQLNKYIWSTGEDTYAYTNDIPSTTSALQNDSGFLTEETDPTVPDWAKAETKPSYTAAEVGALPDTTVIPDISGKVNKTGDTMTGALTLSAGSSNGLTFTNTSYPNITIYANRGWTDTSYDDDYPRLYFGGTNKTGRVILGNILSPAENFDVANKLYVDNKTTIKTTAISNNTEYNLLGTLTTNNNTTAAIIYQQSPLLFSKTTTLSRLTIGSTTLPGHIRLYSNVTDATGYTDLISGATGTNARTITFPDASGTVALTSDIPASYDDTALAARVTALETIPWVTYYTGSSTPSSSQGSDGDLYFQTSGV